MFLINMFYEISRYNMPITNMRYKDFFFFSSFFLKIPYFYRWNVITRV